MKKQWSKKAGIAALLLTAGVLLGGCSSQLEERAAVDLSAAEIRPRVAAPKEDAKQTTEADVMLYFLDEEGMELVPVARRIEGQSGAALVEAALHALCAGPEEGEDAYWPEVVGLNAKRGLEISGGVAVVNLPARMRALSPEELYAVRMAITHTLTEFSQVSYVNVLIAGREEGFDLAATMPMGALSRVEDLDVASRYLRLDETRQGAQDAGVTRLTTLSFPSADGRWLLPEVRSVTYASMQPIEYLYTILEEIGKGTDNPLCRDVPEPMKYIERMPEIVRTEDGAYRAVELRLSASLDEALEAAGLTRCVYLAMITDAILGFIPGVDGVLASIGGEAVTGFETSQTPDGRAFDFEQSLAMRSDFAGYVGAPGVVYIPEGGRLKKVSCVFPQERQFEARQRLWQLTQQLMRSGAIGGGLKGADILAVSVEADCIAVNLSGAYAQAIARLTPQQERAVVYAIVNTLTEGGGQERVAFFFDGEQRAELAGGLEMRGEFLRNPGMVVAD